MHHRNVFLFMFFIIFFYACKKEEVKVNEVKSAPLTITSTVNGGDWDNPKTWIENTVPNDKSDVVISGRVTIKSKVECLNLMIDNEAVLEVEKDASIKVTHHLINEGIIINNGSFEVPNNK